MKKLIKLLFLIQVFIYLLGIWVGFCFGLDIEKDVLPIIAEAESSNNPNAVGSNGEIGLYQISPILLKDYNQWSKEHLPKEIANDPDVIVCYTLPQHLFYPDTNERVALWYIHYRIIPALKENDYPVDIAHIICLYNLGVKRGIEYLKEYGIPKWHQNLVYRKQYKNYWKNKNK